MDTPLDAPRTRDPERTRERILDAAQALILDHGFAATTIDAVVGRAGTTKGAFFHHFGSKSELARALVERYAALDRAHLEENLARAEKLASDPLQQVLLLIALYEEEFEAMEEPFPGCLFASYIYESKLFDAATLEVLRESTLLWRRVMRAKLEEVAAVHLPRRTVDMESLADLFYSLSEGAFIMTKTLGDRTMLARQARHLRTYLELLFGPAAATPPPS
jgi:TetR/AcrR family transcriptional repressor of nem operon